MLKRRDSTSVDISLCRIDSRHGQSAAVEEATSPLQLTRRDWKPKIPLSLYGPNELVVVNEEPQQQQDSNILLQNFPFIHGQPIVKFVASQNTQNAPLQPPLRIGVVLSGGQAAGGHNVISGVYDAAKNIHPHSQVFGFLGGPEGIYTSNYVEINDEFMLTYRNQGGFNMIRSGRHKIDTEKTMAASLQTCQNLDLAGLVVIGGDDSNTNAAILAEYFKANQCRTCVVGCPKTIDGDLKNQFIETPFGFDTAVKTYSEFIGNLCIDVATSGKYYHFIRLMGRSASHITLECAMQTRANMAIIGEEIKEKSISLKDVVAEIVEMVKKRSEMKKDYGVILVPEGLIEFIPDVGILISEVNSILAKGAFEKSKLTSKSLEVFESLPTSIAQQLLLDRDPHGNVQVAKIATEKLLIMMTVEELAKTGNDKSFNPISHYFGYEGRCGMPTNFDSNYCYSLGHVATALIEKKKTGYMALVRNLAKSQKEWIPAACPLTTMMTIEHRKGKDVFVVKKYLVDLTKSPFTVYAKYRDNWKYSDCYRSPGPIQFEGPASEAINYFVQPPSENEFDSTVCTEDHIKKKQYHFNRNIDDLSVLEKHLLETPISINPILKKKGATAIPRHSLSMADIKTLEVVRRSYSVQFSQSKGLLYGVDVKFDADTSENLRVGIVATGQQSPGIANVLCGLYERLSLNKSRLFGFLGAKGLLEANYIEITREDAFLCRNQGGFNMLGRTQKEESIIASEEGVCKIMETCQKLALDGLVMIGGRWTMTDAAVLTERFVRDGINTKIVAVPATQNNNISSKYIECTLGFDTASKCYSQIIGNLLTDAASATKYWYFIRIMGREKSHMVLEASLQSHPTMTLVSEVYEAQGKTLNDVVKDVADQICKRAEAGKNFGAVLIPEGLISELPQIRQLLRELDGVLSTINLHDEKILINELVHLDTSTNRFASLLSPWSMAVLTELPEFIRAQLIQPRTVGRLQLAHISSEELLSTMVSSELRNRKMAGKYHSQFSPVCFYLGFEARSSLPSLFDCHLGMSHGYLAGVAIESGLTGYATSLGGLCDAPERWIPSLFPVIAIVNMSFEKLYASEMPMVPSDMVRLQSRVLQKVQKASTMWEVDDLFCNPGPMQFFGTASFFYNRYLFEEHHHYIKMLRGVQQNLMSLGKTCTFGIDEQTLRLASVALKMALSVTSIDDSEDNLSDQYPEIVKRGNYACEMSCTSLDRQSTL